MTTAITILLAGLTLYFGTIAKGWTCFVHRFHEHGPTQHLTYGRGGFQSAQRWWLVCERCGAKRPGRREGGTL